MSGSDQPLAEPAQPMSEPPEQAPASPWGDWTDVSAQRWDQPPVHEVAPGPGPLDDGPGAGASAGTPYGSAAAPMSYGFGPPAPGAYAFGPGDGGSYGAGQVQPARRRWPWIAGIVAAALVVVGTVGGTVAYQALSGGGRQPESVLPADAVAFAKIDLDPSASQKIAAYRFLNTLPKVGKSFTQGKDLRESLFDVFADQAHLPSSFNYARDVKPWLGDRAAIALRFDASGKAESIGALQVRDQSAATRSLTAIMTFTGTDFGVTFSHGYALLGKDQQEVDTARVEAERAPLSASPHFRADMALLGSTGVSAGWADFGALSSAMRGAAVGGALLNKSRLSYTLRFSPTAAEVVLKSSGGPRAALPARSMPIAALPADTVAAASLSVDNGQLAQAYRQFESRFAQQSGGLMGNPLAAISRQFGLKLPADLQSLIGTDLLLAMGPGKTRDGLPEIAARTTTDPTRAISVMDRIRDGLAAEGAQLPVAYTATADGLAVATDRSYLAAVSGPPTARLGDTASFKAAVPDAAKARSVVFANLDRVADIMAREGAPAEAITTVREFAGLGLTAVTEGDVTTVRIRLVAH
ncbi:DUF3352 domain-containing protein [Jatrophihabitans telluris]|uniref:DUF3352 domain-containing protein n=1 Tax=Jatrophihabitans telluris TaxID=2038343 RepID=A0ABY4R3Q6_9ACTN|nr:DUF3352 domain-containing protein [Jatrophihabitans telluris]UQX90122.1 DUF3352 domain-containing protein [Jatrophihabitans telluris]